MTALVAAIAMPPPGLLILMLLLLVAAALLLCPGGLTLSTVFRCGLGAVCMGWGIHGAGAVSFTLFSPSAIHFSIMILFISNFQFRWWPVSIANKAVSPFPPCSLLTALLLLLVVLKCMSGAILCHLQHVLPMPYARSLLATLLLLVIALVAQGGMVPLQDGCTWAETTIIVQVGWLRYLELGASSRSCTEGCNEKGGWLPPLTPSCHLPWMCPVSL